VAEGSRGCTALDFSGHKTLKLLEDRAAPKRPCSTDRELEQADLRLPLTTAHKSHDNPLHRCSVTLLFLGDSSCIQIGVHSSMGDPSRTHAISTLSPRMLNYLTRCNLSLARSAIPLPLSTSTFLFLFYGSKWESTYGISKKSTKLGMRLQPDSASASPCSWILDLP
jgi:hypothetical protein